MYLMIGDHCSQRVECSTGQASVTSGVTPPEPNALGAGMEQFAKEEITITQIRWNGFKVGKTSNFLPSQL